MSIDEKLIKRFLSHPKDFTFDEMVRLLSIFGYEINNKGKTSGSRVSFFREKGKNLISIHRPHPSNIVKTYAILEVEKFLKENGDL